MKLYTSFNKEKAEQKMKEYIEKYGEQFLIIHEINTDDEPLKD